MKKNGRKIRCMLPLFSDELELQGVKRDNGLPRMGEMGRKLGEEDGGP